MLSVKIMSEMSAILHSYKKDISSCVIVSITGYGDTLPSFYMSKNLNKVDAKVKGIFEMHFEDIDHCIDGYREPRECDFVGLKEFIDKYKSDVEEIIVHCHAGVSRSSGCASAISYYLGLDDKAIWGSSKYIPNRLVNKLALKSLGVVLSEEAMLERYALNDATLENLVDMHKEDLDGFFG